MRHLPNRSHILDIGCGTGEFLNAISDVMNTTGLEPEPHAAEWGRQHFGLDIKTGTLDTVSMPKGAFDLITLWHALEHIPEPLEALQQITELLAPNGKVLIALPNINSFDAKFYGPDWVAIDAPRHLWHFTPDTTRTIAKQSGLKLFASGILPLDHFYNILLSESIHLRSSPQHKLLSPFRMGFALTGSLIKAVVSGEGSGMYSIFVKE